MIYFLYSPHAQAIKIGYTDEATDKRARQLQTAAAEPLAMLGMIPGNRDDELAWHRMWGHIRRKGEWFTATPALREVVRARLMAEGIPPKGISSSFAELAKLEPGLGHLLREAILHRVDAMEDERFCANAVWYGYGSGRGIKARLIPLVGWYRKPSDAVLSTRKSWDVAYEEIYEALPDCRDNCACQTFLQTALSI